MESNYDKQVYIARELFLNYEQETMIRKFQLKHDENWLYLTFLGREYRVSRCSGEIECRIKATEIEPVSDTAKATEAEPVSGTARAREAEPVSDTAKATVAKRAADPAKMAGQDQAAEFAPCLDYQVVMTIYDVLCCSKSMPVLACEWCPVHALQVTMSSPGADTFTGRYAKLFSGNTDRLLTACQKLGGRQPLVRAGADVCREFDVFPFFPVQLRFWDGDDEFEPKIQLLWDKKSLDFMHFETVFYVQGHLMERLAEMSGL